MSSAIKYIPPSTGGLYRHYRNRQLYRVMLVVPMHESDEVVVVYSPVDKPGEVYGRYQEEFLEKFAEVP